VKIVGEEEEKKDIIKFSSELLDLLSNFEEIELEGVEIELGDLELRFQPGVAFAPPAVPLPVKPTTILEEDFIPPIEEYPGRIEEVKLGATKGEGGSRGKTVVIGGADSPAFYLFERTVVRR